MKSFFDSIFISNSSLYGEPEHPMKLEYYKTIEKSESIEANYGIEIIKTEFTEGKVDVESQKLENVTKDQRKIEEILTILRDNAVTPFGMQDILEEIFIQI